MKTKPLTALQKRKRLERSRRDSRVRNVKKYRRLCVSRGFLDYAQRKEWDNETTDAAALIMHYLFMLHKKVSSSGWLPMPFQVFEGLFGRDYKRIRDNLIDSGFLEYDEIRKYRAKSHCSYYRICGELRNDSISASYRLKSKTLQERFIENKKRWKRMSEAKRREHLEANIEAIFPSIKFNAPNKENKIHTETTEHEYLTKEEGETISRLIMNSHLLKVKVNAVHLSAIIEKRFVERTRNNTINCDFDAYEQLIQDIIERTIEPTFSKDEYGRLYTPISGIPKELWDFVYFRNHQLSAIDIKSSHVVCLLALIKDIAINYFGNQGLHEERLSKCQFSRQISMIPGLAEHLHQIIGIDEANKYFEFKGSVPDDPADKRKLMYSLFMKFTKQHNKTLRKLSKTHLLMYSKERSIHVNLVQYVLQYHYNSSYGHKFHIKNKNSHNHVNPNNTSINNYIPDIHSHLNTPFTTMTHSNQGQPSIPNHYVPEENVGVVTQDIVCREVMKNLRACHFRLKSEDKLDEPTEDALLFRNLFFPCPEEIVEFEQMLGDDIYTLLMKSVGMEGMGRKRFKGEFFRFLYRPAFCHYDKIQRWENETFYTEKREEPVRKAMEALLPSIVFFLDLCKCKPGILKRGDYQKISHAILRIESQIMLETCANLWKKYPNMFFVTLHDCIKCLPKDVQKVEAELKRTFERYHVFPEFDVEQHKRPSDVND